MSSIFSASCDTNNLKHENGLDFEFEIGGGYTHLQRFIRGHIYRETDTDREIVTDICTVAWCIKIR